MKKLLLILIIGCVSAIGLVSLRGCKKDTRITVMSDDSLGRVNNRLIGKMLTTSHRIENEILRKVTKNTEALSSWNTLADTVIALDSRLKAIERGKAKNEENIKILYDMHHDLRSDADQHVEFTR